MDGPTNAIGERIRVALAAMPPVVSDTLEDKLGAASIEVVLRGDPEEWSQKDLVADVVIAPTGLTLLAPWCRELLRRRSRLKILTLSTNMNHGDLYELRLVGSNVGVEAVVAAVRSAASVVQ